MMVPAPPATDLVFVEPNLSFRLLEAGLDRPAARRNPAEQEQWRALGFTDPAAASDIITARFDYSFNWIALIVMAVLVVGYFVLVVRLSDREYREVIAERFGDRR